MIVKEAQFLKIQKSTCFLYILDIIDSNGCYSFIRRSSAGIACSGIYPPTFKTILPPQAVLEESHIQMLFEHTIFLSLVYE